MDLIFDNINENNFDKIIYLSSNFNEFIKFFCSKYKYIRAHSIKINLDNYEYDIDENIGNNELIKFLEIWIELKNPFPEQKFLNLIKKLDKNDYRKLYFIKTIFSKYNVKNKILNKSFHETGKIFIENNKLNNLEIITFIQEDAKEYYEIYEKDFEYIYLIKHIDLDKIDNKFCEKFKENQYDYEKLFKENYLFFLDAIMGLIKSFENLKKVYQIFEIETKQKQNNKIINELIESLTYNKLYRHNLKIKEFI